MQVFELANELAVRSVDVLDAAQAAGVPARDAGSQLDADQAERVRAAHHQRVAEASAIAATAPVLVPAAPPPPPMVEGALAPPPPPTEPPPVAPGLGGWGVGSAPVGYRSKPPMHPLIRKAIWQFAAAQVVPCIGIYWFFAAYMNAGKGRTQVLIWRGKWGGDTAGMIIQILFWIELAIGAISFSVSMYSLSHGGPPTTSVPR